MYLLPLGVCLIIGGLAGVFGNTMIILALIKSSDLRGWRCSPLIGNLALADLINCITLIYSGIHTILQTIHPEQMSNEFCYYTRIPAIICYTAAALLILVIGIDRAVSLWFPVFYNKIPRGYIMAGISFPWVYGLMIVVIGYFCKDPTVKLISCSVPAALRGFALKTYNNSNIIINILVVVSYTTAFWKAKILKNVQAGNNAQTERNNHILMSLVICAGTFIAGTVLSNLVVFLVNTFFIAPIVAFHVMSYMAIFATVTMGCNFYVYYWRSADYRRVFRDILGCKDNQVSPIIIHINPSNSQQC